MKKGKELTSIREKITKYENGNKCSFDGCDREAKSKGLCSTHYKQMKKCKELTHIRNYNLKGDVENE